MGMLIRDKDKPMLGKVLMWGSGLAAGLSGIGAMGQDIYLASTQWLLVAILLAAWAIYLLLEAEFRS